NPISDTFKLKETHQKNKPIQYITVGRLSKEKGIDRILKILSKLNHPFHYTLIGNGAEREHLFDLVKDYNLTDNITHIEFTKDVSTYLERSDVFLQGSHFEGFPNCLIESCSVGTPVIAFNVPGGTKEIVQNNVNGFLVENEDEFIEKLNDFKDWHPEEGRASVYQKLNKDLILHKYKE